MMLTSNGEVLAENKVLILYIINKIGKPIDNDSLLNLVISTVDMNYFYFQQFLLDLQEKNYIISFEKENTIFYDITKEGKNTLKLTEDIVPGIIKLKIDSNFKEELDTIMESHSIIAEYTPNSENDYIVTCKIMDNNESIFEVKTFAGSRDQAKHIVDNWNRNADKLYPKLLEILTKSKK